MKGTMTGNRALLKIKGTAVAAGIVQSANVSDDFGTQRISGLGTPEAVELVPGEVSHTITMNKFFVYNQKLKDLGYLPDSKEYLTSGELDIEIIDNITGATLEHYTGCKAANAGRDYSKHGPSTESITFMAIHKVK